MKLTYGRVMSVVAVIVAALFIALFVYLDTRPRPQREPRSTTRARATYFTTEGVIGAVDLADAKELIKALVTRDEETLRWAFVRYNGIIVPAGKRAELLDISGMAYVQIKVHGLTPIVWTTRAAIE